MIETEQRTLFLRQGYSVVPDVVPKDLCQRSIQAILDYTNIDIDDEHSWYRESHAGHGIVPLHHHQAFWDIRQCPDVHEVFADIYNDEKLWVSMDRASYKPPAAAEAREWKQSPVHWDCDPWDPDGFAVQGFVYLTDTSEDQGAFICVPAIWEELSEYCHRHADDKDRRKPAVEDKDLLRVAGTAGSLVLFNRLMPHTSGLNQSKKHRFVQYVTMQPVGDEITRAQRVSEWKEKMPPEWAIMQKVNNQEIPESGKPAVLTDLGRKLVGVDPWL